MIRAEVREQRLRRVMQTIAAEDFLLLTMVLAFPQ
jgi:hypothetical protein